MTNSLIGQTIGRYEILDMLGRGGMASVYRARDAVLHREIALKILYQQYTADQSSVERFKQEAITAARLDHPNIVPVYDVGQQGDLIYIAMKLLRGQSLQELLEGGRTLSVRHTLAVADSVAQALDYAHGRGVVHRDIKPGNIFIERPITSDGTPGPPRAMLTDFGIAKSLDAPGTTRTGIMIGTPDYMAPEQIRGEAISGRADIYALGLVVYRALAGRMPFRGDTQAVLMAQLSQAPEPPSTINPDLSPALDAVILRALAKRPEERYASAGAFVAALLNPQQAAPPAAPLHQQPTVVVPQAPQPAQRPPTSSQPRPDAPPPPYQSGRLTGDETYSTQQGRPAAAPPPARQGDSGKALYGGLLAVIVALLAALLYSVWLRGDNSGGLLPTPTTEQIVPGLPTAVLPLPTETPSPEPPTPAPPTEAPAPEATTALPTAAPPTAAPPTNTPQVIIVTPTPLPPTATTPPSPVPPTATTPPSPTPEPSPTTDPVAACSSPDLFQGGFGALWRANPEVQAALDCPTGGEQGRQAVSRAFENGLMVWLGDPDRTIVVLNTSTGIWSEFADTYVEGEALEPVEDAPAGLFVPDRGFGKLWRNEDSVRAALGYSTEPSEVGEFPGARQAFDKGQMIFIDDPVRGALIFVLEDLGRVFAQYEDPTRQ